MANGAVVSMNMWIPIHLLNLPLGIPMFALTVHWIKLVPILRLVLINNYLLKLPFG